MTPIKVRREMCEGSGTDPAQTHNMAPGRATFGKCADCGRWVKTAPLSGRLYVHGPGWEEL